MENTAQKRVAVLVVAGGVGTRAGGEIPKQYQKLGGISVLRRTLTAFLVHPKVDAIAVVVHPEHSELYQEAARGLALLPPVIGGVTRQESVRNGLEALEDQGFDYVLIHDAARPFVSETVISRVLGALMDGAIAVLPAVQVADTIKRTENGNMAETLPRENLVAAQTPQGFSYSKILEWHRMYAGAAVTDDTALAEMADAHVAVVVGDAANRKLTTREDMVQGEAFLHANRPLFETRVGQGFDVHAFVPFNDSVAEDTKTIQLCGVPVKHTHALEGHSDADAGLHALTDALLGSLGLGDIGAHFPPSNPQWKNADSAQFLAHAGQLLAEHGARIVHVDVTLICELPKIGPHRDAMRARIAQILHMDVNRVSVKATTTEGLGFTGRKEGLAAQALATVELPRVLSDLM